MRFLTATFAVLLLTVSTFASSPNDAVLDAVKDCRQLPPSVRVSTRYLSLYNIPEKDRVDFLRALTFQCNSLSREAEIVQPRLVTPELVAVVLFDYRWQTKTFDRLQDFEPYFHIALEINEDVFEEVIEKVQVDKPTGKKVSYDYGRTWVNETVRVTEDRTVKKKVGTHKVKKATASAPWLDAPAIAELIILTQSTCPIVRADWFIAQVGISRKDEVSYYDFLELGKKEEDFQRLIGADPKLAIERRKEIAAILGRSGVAINNRRVVRLGAIDGPYWFTEDFKTSKGKQNVLRFLDGETEPPKGDASEQYGTLPNGLFAYYLVNAKGERQDSVPDDIAADGHTTSNDRKIYSGKSCIACHVEGIRPINDYARRIFRNQIQLQSVDYEKFVRLRQLYLSDLEGRVKRDNEEYAAVLIRVNGLTPAANARLYEKTFDGYTEADLGPEEVARELGVTKERLLAALKTYGTATGNLEPLLAGLLQNPAVLLRRDHVEEFYPLLQVILKAAP